MHTACGVAGCDPLQANADRIISSTATHKDRRILPSQVKIHLARLHPVYNKMPLKATSAVDKMRLSYYDARAFGLAIVFPHITILPNAEQTPHIE